MTQMKDSGVKWIGEIPSDWELKKLGDFYTQRNEKVSDKEYSPLSVTMQGILPQLETAAKTNDGDNRKLVRKGDFAINSRSDRRGSCGISSYDGSVSLINIVLTPKGEMNADFYNWLFHTSMFADEYYRWGHGIVDDLWTTRWSEMRNITVVCPPLATQQRIASYLDGKCGEIDRLVSLQEEIIAELKAYKQSVITEAVTKGLNPNAKMKDSGVEWIGEIPNGWKVKRLKNILRKGLQYGANESGNLYTEGLPRYVRITDILDNHLRNDIQIQSLTEEQAEGYILEDGDVLFARSGGTVGKAFIYRSEYGRCAYAGYLIRACVDSNNSADYLYYYTQSASYEKWKEQIFIQATIQNIGGDKYALMDIPCPTLTEQHAIVSYLDYRTSEIDSLISLKEQKISELKEYKKSLIYEVVTGKKEV